MKIELKVGDLIVYTYKGELELARIWLSSTSKGIGIELPARKEIDSLPNDAVVYRCVWKQDKPLFRSQTTLGAVRSKLR